MQGAPDRLLVIVGPTGTGKTELAIELALRLRGEIVGCDALQVYRGFDTATSKPGAAQRRQVTHHLVDVVDPRRDFTLAEYVQLADRTLHEIAQRGNLPLVVGGTGLYLRGLLRGIVKTPGADEPLRGRLRGMMARRGSERLHRWLHSLDPRSAARIRPQDPQRIQRALELALSAGPTWSERLEAQGAWDASDDRFPSVKVALDTDRDELNRRLDDRVDRFFDQGLVDEVRDLLRRGVPAAANAFKAIGYREVLGALQRGEDAGTVRDAVKRNTRRYAKRQRTWFRKEPGLQWLDAAAGVSTLADEVARLWH